MQDRIALDTEEEEAIELKREFGNGQDLPVWNPSLSIAAKGFEFNDAQTARIRAAIETCAQYSAASDRQWLEPLLDALFCSGLKDGK